MLWLILSVNRTESRGCPGTWSNFILGVSVGMLAAGSWPHPSFKIHLEPMPPLSSPSSHTGPLLFFQLAHCVCLGVFTLLTPVSRALCPSSFHGCVSHLSFTIITIPERSPSYLLTLVSQIIWFHIYIYIYIYIYTHTHTHTHTHYWNYVSNR